MNDEALLVARYADGTVVFDSRSGDTHRIPREHADCLAAWLEKPEAHLVPDSTS